MDAGDRLYISVWRTGLAGRGIPNEEQKDDQCELHVPKLKGKRVTVDCLYPTQLPTEHAWDSAKGSISVMLTAVPSARLLKISILE
jgi:hypothetical protein